MSESNNNTQAQAMPEITLTLTPDEVAAENEAKLAELENKKEEAPKDPLEGMMLSDAEKKMIDDFSKKIDITESNTVLQYGSAAQKKVTDFSNTALQNVRTKDLGEIGSLLSDLVVELKDFDNKEEKKGLAGLFSKGKSKVEDFKIRYDNAEANVDKIANVLEDHQITLLKDIALLDQLYERNAQNTKELAMYILAGKRKLASVRSNELPAAIAKAKASGLPEDAQAANDLEQACVRFEKKLYDLELTRQVSVQMAPQIRLVQNNDTLMTEKIQSTLVNTIPLWKSQMLIALGIAHSKEAVKAQNEVSEMTNKMLKENAENLKMATIETAKESERGIVDIETLTETNKKLIETLEEVKRIQIDGREKRAAAQQELRRIETELQKELTNVINK
ncbi:MAG: toxic anion resistance protein [Solobacterium sp.]|nr:toxic anion resistance protein [Solobacterium sp.]